MKITPKKYAQELAIMLDTAERTIISNFLQVLRQRRQLKLLPKILRAFRDEWLRRRGYKKREITYPKEFKESLPELEKKLREALGDKLSISTVSSENLIGGFRLRVEDTMFDASVESALKALKQKLIS